MATTRPHAQPDISVGDARAVAILPSPLVELRLAVDQNVCAPPPPTVRTCASACLLVAVLLSTAVGPVSGNPRPDGPRHPGADAAWPGWRGASAEGRALGPLPTSWSAVHGIRWKTPIPGRGHSSPVVFGDRIFITTAVPSERGVLLHHSLGWLTAALALVVVGLVVWLAIERSDASRWSSSALVVLALVIGTVAASSESLFDAGRDPTRGWMIGTSVVSMCLALAMVTVRGRSRLTLAAGASLFGLFALVAFPSRDFIFRSGVSAMREQLALAVIMTPIAIAFGAALIHCSRSWSTRVRWLTAAAALTPAAVVLARLIHHLLVFHDASVPDTQYKPQLNAGATAAIVALFLLSGHFFVRRPRAPAGSAAAVLIGALGIMSTATLAIESIAARSQYLAYQLAGRATALPGNGVLVAVALAACAGAALAVGRRRSGMADHRSLARLAMLLALALGAAYFFRVNYAQTRDEMFRAIVSLDRDSGDVLWIARGLHGPAARIDGRNSPATPTPVTDGRSVCAYFGSPGVMCADVGGRLLWTRGPIFADGYYGVASSPVLADGAVVIASDRPDGRASLLAFDVLTGAERWAHTFPTTPTLSGNSRTPLVGEVNGRAAVVLWGMQYLKAVSIRSGVTLWNVPWSSGGDLVSSLTADERRMYLSDATGTVAIEHGRLTLGDATRLWTSKARSNCATPVVANGHLFTVSDSGIAAAIDVETGAVRWQQRLPGRYFSSPVASASAVYFTNSDGITTVVAADGHFRVVASNDLGEEIMATMAAANGELIIRSVSHLYAVGAPVVGHGRGTPFGRRRGTLN